MNTRHAISLLAIAILFSAGCSDPDIPSLRKQLVDSQGRIDELEKERDRMDAKIKQALAFEDSRKDDSLTKQQLKELGKRIEAIEKNSVTAAEAMNEKLGELDAAIKRAGQANKVATDTVNAMQVRIAKTDAGVAGLKKIVDAHETNLTHATRQLDSVGKELFAMRKTITDQVNGAAAKIKEVSDQVTKLGTSVTEVKQQSGSTQESIQKLVKDSTGLQDAIKKLTGDSTRFKEVTTKLTKDTTGLQNTLAKLSDRASKDDLEKSVATVSAKLAEVETAGARSNESTNKRMDVLTAQLKTLQDQLSVLSKTVEEVKKSTESSEDTSSSEPENVPEPSDDSDPSAVN